MTDSRDIPELGERLAADGGIWLLTDLNGRSIFVDLERRRSYAPEKGTPGALSSDWEAFQYRPEVRVGNPVFFVREGRWERTALIRSFEPAGAETER